MRRRENPLDLDATSGYGQVEISREDQHKATIASHHGILQFFHMPFCLKNAPGTFQQVMAVILSTVDKQLALVYLNEILIFRKSLRYI